MLHVVLLAALASLVVAPSFARAQQVDPFDISLYATASDGGALATDYDFAQASPVSRSLCAGGLCLYSATDPGFISRSTGAGGLFALAAGTEVAFEVVALDAGVSVKIDAAVLDAPGESASLGVAPALHVHPEWQVTRPEGERGRYAVSFRLVQRAGSAAYAPSTTYTLLLENGAPLPTATPAPTPSPGPSGSPLPPELVREVPRARGDQLVLYYDARDGFTTFLNLANEGEGELEVALLLYGGAMAAPPLERRLAVAARGTRTIDVGALRGEGLPAEPGVAFAFAVNDAGEMVTSRVLAGNLTVANLRALSAWGAPAAARLARSVASPESLPAAGTPVDGSTVVLEQIRPTELDLAVYYDPATLQPADEGGNQLVFLSFADHGGAAYAAVPAATAWDVDVRRSDGATIASPRHASAGVEVTHLAALAGDGAHGAAGSVRFTSVAPGGANRLLLFAESLGTFATGYVLPAVGPARAQEALAVPAGQGDQVLLVYDAREGFTTFLNLANRGDTDLEVRLALLPADLATPFEVTRVLPARSTQTIDVGALRTEGLGAGAGIALLTATEGGVAVTSGALAGSFTVANLTTSSAWGAPGAARSALRAGGVPPPGTPVDGVDVVLQALAPVALDLSVYYDPDTLEPAEAGGNQLILVSFDDAADAGVRAAPTTWRVSTTRSDGTEVSSVERTSSGVELTDLGSVAGSGVAGAAGRMLLTPSAGAASNRVAFFVESLGTFATGYLLPALDQD